MPNPIRVIFRSENSTEHVPGRGEGLRMALFQGQGDVGSVAAVEANLTRLEQVLRLAADHRCHLCVFPEMYTTGYALNSEICRDLAEPLDGPSVTRVRAAAESTQTAVAFSLVEQDGDEIFDTVLVIGPHGKILASYRKTHLYGAAEQAMFTAGHALPPIVEINGLKVGVLLCYECEFPPLYQYLAEHGAQVVICPTAADRHFRRVDGVRTQVPYPDATRHIIPAMAAVWRLFVAYANRRGFEQVKEGDWDYRGNSGVWGPDGEAVVAAGSEDAQVDCLLIGECWPDRVTAFSPEGNHRYDNRLALDEKHLR
jgi:predicted amidohydrolase